MSELNNQIQQLKVSEITGDVSLARQTLSAEHGDDLFNRAEQIVADTMSVPFQQEKNFSAEDKTAESLEWRNKLIFGDNLQILKSLIQLKKVGDLKNADGTDASPPRKDILKLQISYAKS